MKTEEAIQSSTFSPKFDIEKRLSESFLKVSDEKIVADVGKDQFHTKKWHPDSHLQISSALWIQKYGLRANHLDPQTLFPKLGFPNKESFNTVLNKPIHSCYAYGKFPKHLREDGVTFNIVATKGLLLQSQAQLENAILLYQQRLDWLSSESRRIFGVIEEHCITVVIDIKNQSSTQFDQFICAVERLINEQIRHCVKFNMIRVQDTACQLFTSLMPVSNDTLSMAVDWLWKIDRTQYSSTANILEAVIRASNDTKNEAIYLITEGLSSDGSREILREKVKLMRVPFHIVSYNCADDEYLQYLNCLVSITGGRFHTYTFNMEVESFEPMPIDEMNPMANIVVKKKVYGSSVGGIGKRKDCVDIFSELEEAKLICNQIQSLLNQIPERSVQYDEPEHNLDHGGHVPREEYMSSREWLAKFGLRPRKLDFFDVLSGVCFRHCDGVVDVLEPPPQDKIDLMDQQNATIHQKLVNAKYCDKFAHVRWKDGSLVHVQMSSDVHRLYSQRMNICLNAIKRRIDWLRQGSRELFGTIMEDQIYILIDTSASMEPHIRFLKDKMYTLIQEQLRHKTKLNFVAFNSRALPWRDRLVDVTETSLNSAWHWLEGLSCQGSTNTLEALQFAIKDRGSQGIYLLTDGRPDQPTKTVLSQIKLQHRLPIHTISFNCADLEANTFLCELARETGGRFHYFNEVSGAADCTDEEALDAWQSEDIQALKAEYRLGTESLEKVTKLRDECHRLAWRKEIESQKEQKPLRKTMLPGCTDGLSRQKRIASRIASNNQNKQLSKRIRAKNTFKNDPADPGAYFAFLQAINAHSSNEQDWMLQETQDILDRQKERYKETLQKDMKEIVEKQKSEQKPKKPKCKDLTLKQWINIYGLVPQHMTILDALAPTIVKVRPKYIPIIDKHVISKVFDEILPIAHVVTEGNPRRGYKPVVRLVNPLAVDLKGYQNHLDELLKKYKKKLRQLIKDNINSEVLEEFDQLTTSEPLGSEDMKRWILKVFEDSDWPICEDDLQMFLKEISIGHKYFIQAGDLIRVQRRALDKDGSDKDGLPESKHNKRSSEKNNQFPDIMLAAMNGVAILAPGMIDGYYYEANIINWPDCENVEVQFNSFGDNVNVPVSECILMPSKDAIIRPGMKALIKVYNVDNDRTFYLPGIIISPPQKDAKSKDERFIVSLYNGIESNVRKDEIVVITKERYDAIVRNIESKDVDNYGSNTTMSDSMASYSEDPNVTNIPEIKNSGADFKATHFDEINLRSKSKHASIKNQKGRLSKRTQRPSDRIRSKSQNKIESKTVGSPLSEETKDTRAMIEDLPEMTSEPNFRNIGVVDSNAPAQFNASRSSRKSNQNVKTAKDRHSKVLVLETPTSNIKPIPSSAQAQHSVESKINRKPSINRKITHVNEQKLLKKKENVKPLETKPSKPTNSLINIEPAINSKVKESINGNVVEGSEHSLKNENYRMHSSEVHDPLNISTIESGQPINSPIRPSPLASGEKTVPIFVAQQFPAPSDHSKSRITTLPEKNAPYEVSQNKENVEHVKSKKTLPLPLSPKESEQRNSCGSRSSCRLTKESIQSVEVKQESSVENQQKSTSPNKLNVPRENPSKRSSIRSSSVKNPTSSPLVLSSQVSSESKGRRTSSKSSSNKELLNKNKGATHKKSSIHGKEAPKVTEKPKRNASITSKEPQIVDTKSKQKINEDSKRPGASKKKSKEEADGVDEGNNKRNQTKNQIFPRESFLKQKQSQERTLESKKRGEKNETDNDDKRKRKESILSTQNLLNQAKTEDRKNEIDDQDPRKRKESIARLSIKQFDQKRPKQEESEDERRSHESHIEIDDVDARNRNESLAGQSIKPIDQNQLNDEEIENARITQVRKNEIDPSKGKESLAQQSNQQLNKKLKEEKKSFEEKEMQRQESPHRVQNQQTSHQIGSNSKQKKDKTKDDDDNMKKGKLSQKRHDAQRSDQQIDPDRKPMAVKVGIDDVVSGQETASPTNRTIHQRDPSPDKTDNLIATSRSPSPYSAKSNVTIVEDGNDQVYNIVLTPEPAILLLQPDNDCKSFQISQLTISVKEIPSQISSRTTLSPTSMLNKPKCDHAAKGLSKSSNDLCEKCHLPVVPFGPGHQPEPKRSKSF